MINRFRAVAILSVLVLVIVSSSSYAATSLRIMTLNAEWLVLCFRELVVKYSGVGSRIVDGFFVSDLCAGVFGSVRWLLGVRAFVVSL